jgi:hypothetical protein
MTEKKPVVYDPDPTDFQMAAFEGMSLSNLQTTDLCSPEAVQLLVHMQRVTLLSSNRQRL